MIGYRVIAIAGLASPIRFAKNRVGGDVPAAYLPGERRMAHKL